MIYVIKSVTFAAELKWIDLYCLQPQEKMLKILYCLMALPYPITINSLWIINLKKLT